ncbi:MAG: indolepyruvate oxidoreductase subunit beta [Candidatus Bathyarchaeia archaeon]
MIAGVGGQGVILTALIIANAAVKEGLDALVSEIHGMAQRGGAVISHVRIGRGIHDPSVTEGTADAILALEPAEALRALRYASSETRMIINTKPVIPTTVFIGSTAYPPIQKILDECRKFSRHIIPLDAYKLALEAGSPLAQNIVLLGVLVATKIFPIKKDTILDAIKELVSGRYLEANVRAFLSGLETLPGLES